MKVYTFISVDEAGINGFDYTYRGVSTKITEAVRYVRPDTKIDFDRLSLAGTDPYGKRYYVIRDGEDVNLLIFEDELKEVPEPETKEVEDKPSKLDKGSISPKTMTITFGG